MSFALRYRTVLCFFFMSNNIFSYDSKLNNVLGFIGDLFLVNILYVVFSLPVVTMGAAQAGLYTAMRILQNQEDDRPVVKAFFRGFKSGFFKITLNFLIFLILDIMLLYTLWVCYTNQELGMFVHWAFPLVILLLCLVIHALLPAFHSQFNCKPFHLFRNCLLLFISHPLRSVLVAALTWAPAILYFLNTTFFVNVGAAFISVYYSIAFMFNAMLLSKPFEQLMEDDACDEEIEDVK